MPRLPKEVEAFMNVPHKRSWRSRFFWFGFWLLVICGLAGFFGYTYYRDLAKKEDIAKVGELPQRSIVFDRKGVEIGRLHGANRINVPLDGVSPFFVDALLAREDSRFYRHAGIDYRGVARATVRNIKDWEFVQGASTLTMQLARVSYDIRDKSLHRKLLEAMLARRIEQAYDKEQILELYINRVYFGTGIYGIERAAKAHFGKPAAELTLSESAMLAGIIRAPNRFSPFRHLEGAKRERDTVLGRMSELGFITEDELAAAKAEEIEVRSAEESRVFQNSYALDMVRRDLDLILEKAETEDGGLLIYTTFDLELQKAAEAAVETKLVEIEEGPNFGHPTRAEFLENAAEGARPTYLQGAAIAIDNSTGGIRAIVGGRDFRESQFNRATQSKRQIGSLFKPFVYSAAYQRG
ncbi:MAG: transglycosylase domain-containing protein, partial [Verrucomicrobiota bacterium]